MIKFAKIEGICKRAVALIWNESFAKAGAASADAKQQSLALFRENAIFASVASETFEVIAKEKLKSPTELNFCQEQFRKDAKARLGAIAATVP